VDKNFWSTIKVCVIVLEPAVKVLRYSDGMRRGTLGLMYNLLLQLDELYSSLVERLVRTHTNLQLEHRLESMRLSCSHGTLR
jgi:hypothetical protein